jgi:hypothetical protein
MLYGLDTWQSSLCSELQLYTFWYSFVFDNMISPQYFDDLIISRDESIMIMKYDKKIDSFFEMVVSFNFTENFRK